MGEHDPEIEGLVDEHRELMAIMAPLRRATDDAEIDRLLEQMQAELARHTEREETGLFHTLRSIDVGPEYMGLFEHDHGYLEQLIESARADHQRVGELVDALDAHMAREENDMFPAAEQLLGPADWEAVNAAVAQLR